MLTRAQRKRAGLRLDQAPAKRPRVNSSFPPAELRYLITRDALVYVFDCMDPLAAFRLAQTCTMAWSVWRAHYRWLSPVMIIYQTLDATFDDMLPIAALRHVYHTGRIPARFDPHGDIAIYREAAGVSAHRYHSGLAVDVAPNSHPTVLSILTLLLKRVSVHDRLDFFCQFAAGKVYPVHQKVVQDVFRIAIYRQLFADISAVDIRAALTRMQPSAAWELGAFVVVHALHVEVMHLMAECNAMATVSVLLVLLQQLSLPTDVQTAAHTIDLKERMRFYIRHCITSNNVSFAMQVVHGLRHIYAGSSVRELVVALADEWIRLSSASTYSDEARVFACHFASGVSLWPAARQARILARMSAAIGAKTEAPFIVAISELTPMWFQQISQNGILAASLVS